MCLTKQSISDFYRDPQLRVTLDVEKLARLFDPWPQMEYRISHCSIVCFTHSLRRRMIHLFFSHGLLFADSITIFFSWTFHIILT